MLDLAGDPFDLLTALHPEQLGEQLAPLLDGASVRTRALDIDALPTAAAIAAILIANAFPSEPSEAAEN
ncbi:hypothetical protein ACFVJ5_27260 [Nocardia sp. NPDC127606]|uniref:hypothetical protein n=1 Tax=Nocardia sp. NPDC127606 TaxID=3345406 RepID=UPI0036289C40